MIFWNAIVVVEKRYFNQIQNNHNTTNRRNKTDTLTESERKMFEEQLKPKSDSDQKMTVGQDAGGI